MFRLRGLLGGAGSFATAHFSSCGATKTGTQPSGCRQSDNAVWPPRWLSWHQLAPLLAACLWAGQPVRGASPVRPSLNLIGRTVTQDQGAWVLDYRLRYAGPTGIVVTPEEIGVKVEGWVSNSRVASHAVPRWSSLALTRGSELSAVSEVIASVDESQRCRERLLVSVSAEKQTARNPGTSSSARSATVTGGGSRPVAVSTSTARSMILPLSLGPGAVVRIRLRIDHEHIIFGDYDPLLAVRKVELTLGNLVVRDEVALDSEQYLAQPKFTWPEPPEDRRDSRHAISGPDSLHLEAHVPGHHYYRFPGRPVRYSSKMRLRFWYLIAAGTEGQCRVRVTQLKDTPASWRPLHNGNYEQTLKTVGRWTKVEHVIQTEPEATTLTLEFQIAGETDIGEMWIDDVSVDPAGSATPCGP